MTLPINTQIGNWTFPTYTLLLSLAVLLSGGVLLFPYRRQPALLIPICNTLLGALLGAVLVARVVHVLLDAPYFVDHVEEALLLDAGGLDWHGAILGGLSALVLVARWYTPRLKLPVRPLLDGLALCVGLLALAGWVGCLAANCAYGREVPSALGYPPLFIVESSDEFGALVPRYNTYGLGVLLALVLFVVALVAQWRGWFIYRRFWLVIALLCVGMFGIGFVRGDYAVMLVGLRADQWLDMGMLIVSLQRLAVSR
ncbi:MAG: prolipoprotein diacylglyceryl transferase family protein [Anaerolineae bacterium]